MSFQFDFDTCITTFEKASDYSDGVKAKVNDYILKQKQQIPNFWTGKDADAYLESLNNYTQIVEKLNSALKTSELYFKEIKSFYEKVNDEIRRQYNVNG